MIIPSSDPPKMVDLAMSAPHMSKNVTSRLDDPVKKTWTYFPHDSPRSKVSMNDFTRTKVLPPLIERAQVAQFIKRQQINAMIEGRYEDAEKNYLISKEYTKTCKESMREDVKQYTIHKINNEVESINEEIKVLNEECDSEIKKIYDEGNKEMEIINQKNDQNVRDFIRKWESEDALYEFTKPSPMLMRMRDREKNLILSKDFQNASEIKRQGDLIEKEETKRAQKAAQDALQRERNEIENENIKMKRELTNKISRKCSRLERNKNKRISQLETRVKKLELDRDTGYFPQPREEQTDIETEGARNPMALTTPRTRKRFHEFKSKTSMKKLPMRGIKAGFIAKDMPRTKLVVPVLAMSR